MMNSFYGGGMHLWGPAFGLVLAPIVLIIFVVALLLKGYALWTSARRGEKWWFIVMMVVNTAGILELVYLLAFAKVLPKHTDVPPANGSNGPTAAPKA